MRRGGTPFAQLRTWAQWWADVGTKAQCCQFASDELLEEPDAWNCETCEYRQQLTALTEENQVAWQIWRLIGSRFAMDFGTARWVLDATTRDWPADDVHDLAQRLAVIYDTVSPPPES